MAENTGIAWTDSTFNSWWGCMKVSPACNSCYAEVVDKRAPGGVTHWGAGAPRRLLSETARNEPFRWQRKADAFFAEHGRDRRVFTLSMGDLLDNEVPDEWRHEHMMTMEVCDRLRWQICTKRIGNLAKMMPATWDRGRNGDWPQHIGVLITVVTQEEADRDIPKLLAAKARFGIPWVGVSYEPALGEIDFTLDRFVGLDWIIYGGESGGGWRPMPSLDYARGLFLDCRVMGVAFFFKQVAAFRPTDGMIPEDLRVREYPKALQ